MPSIPPVNPPPDSLLSPPNPEGAGEDYSHLPDFESLGNEITRAQEMAHKWGMFSTNNYLRQANRNLGLTRAYTQSETTPQQEEYASILPVDPSKHEERWLKRLEGLMQEYQKRQEALNPQSSKDSIVSRMYHSMSSPNGFNRGELENQQWRKRGGQ